MNFYAPKQPISVMEKEQELDHDVSCSYAKDSL